MSKIRETSPDKIYGKLVKYRKGDCLSIDCNNGFFLAVLVSRKYNKYYDFTLLEYYKKAKPNISDFINGKFFGTRFGSWEDLIYGVNVRMIQCKYVDNCKEIEKIGDFLLNDEFKQDGYAYLNTIDELLNHYTNELPIRIEKSKNAEKFPDLAFVSKHLIEFKVLLQK